jgi:hypothetical protein
MDKDISLSAYSEWSGSMDDLKGLVTEKAITGESMLLNMGPQHPSAPLDAWCVADYPGA